MNPEWSLHVVLEEGDDWSPSAVRSTDVVEQIDVSAREPRTKSSRDELRSQVHLELQRTERNLFEAVKAYLVLLHGDGWWREGISQPIRAEAADRRERAPIEGPRESYLDLSHLVRTIEGNWQGLKKFFPKLAELGAKAAIKELGLSQLINVRIRDAHAVQLPFRRSTDR